MSLLKPHQGRKPVSNVFFTAVLFPSVIVLDKLEYDEERDKYKLNITSLRVNHVYNNVYAWSR